MSEEADKSTAHIQSSIQASIENLRLSFPLIYSAGTQIVKGRDQDIKIWYYGQYNRALYQACITHIFVLRIILICNL